MYGYLKPDNTVLEFDIRSFYRERYCSLCHALWNYYGSLSRMLLSYDVTFAAIILDLDSQVDFNRDKILCYKQNRIVSQKDHWKSLSAISILLAAGKLRDNVSDEHSFLAKLLLAVYSRSIKRAEREYPELSVFLKSNLDYMSELESKNGTLEQLSDAFAKMMCGAYEILCKASDYKLAIIQLISKWIYFIDALDDLEKDIKRGSYNPLSFIAKTKNELIEHHWEIVEGFISSQRELLLPYSDALANNSLSNKIIRSIINDTIPEVTRRVLLNEPINTYTSVHLRLIQSKGGIIFA